MESAAANLVRPGDKILACAAGKFGERWIQLAEAYGAELVRYEPGWGERLDPAEIDRLLTDNAGIRVAFATLSETSTGIVHDIQAVAGVAASTSTLSTPTPARPMTLRRSPRAMRSAVSLVAERMRMPW